MQFGPASFGPSPRRCLLCNRTASEHHPPDDTCPNFVPGNLTQIQEIPPTRPNWRGLEKCSSYEEAKLEILRQKNRLMEEEIALIRERNTELKNYLAAKKEFFSIQVEKMKKDVEMHEAFKTMTSNITESLDIPRKRARVDEEIHVDSVPGPYFGSTGVDL